MLNWTTLNGSKNWGKGANAPYHEFAYALPEKLERIEREKPECQRRWRKRQRGGAKVGQFGLVRSLSPESTVGSRAWRGAWKAANTADKRVHAAVVLHVTPRVTKS